MSAKIKALAKLIKTCHRDIQIHTKEFKEEPTSLLHYKMTEEQGKICTQPTLIYPETL